MQKIRVRVDKEVLEGSPTEVLQRIISNSPIPTGMSIHQWVSGVFDRLGKSIPDVNTLSPWEIVCLLSKFGVLEILYEESDYKF